MDLYGSYAGIPLFLVWSVGTVKPLTAALKVGIYGHQRRLRLRKLPLQRVGLAVASGFG